MVSIATYRLLLWGGLGLAVIGLLGAIIREARHSSTAILARSNGWPKPRRSLVGWLPFVGLIVGVAFVVSMYRYELDVWVVSDGEHGPVARHVMAREIDEDLTKIDAGTMFHESWVVNRSSHEVRVETVAYGPSMSYGFEDNEPTRLSPGSAAAFSGIDHVGPDDVPPGEVTGDRRFGATRHWLVW